MTDKRRSTPILSKVIVQNEGREVEYGNGSLTKISMKDFDDSLGLLNETCNACPLVDPTKISP